MKAILLCVLLVISVTAILPRKPRQYVLNNFVHNELDEAQMFAAWKAKYSKVYATPLEEAASLQNFKASVVRVQERNAKAKNPVFGLTKFSDMSPTQFRQHLGYVSSGHHDVGVLPAGPIKAPQQFDWRKQDRVTNVKDQGQCGSCWAFSVTENVESVYMIKNNIGSADMPPLSPQEIVDCDTDDAGCNGGDPPTAYKYIINAGGLETDADYPYTASGGSCQFDKTKVKAAISSWKYATDPNTKSEPEMQDALVNWGGLSICVDASSWQDYSGGVLMASDCSDNLDHCVQAVGYDLTQSPSFWIVRNSWGTDWGESGYIKLEFGQDTCGCAEEATSSFI